MPAKANMMGHTGSAYGLNSAFYFDPKGKYGFVSMMNGSFERTEKKAISNLLRFRGCPVKSTQGTLCNAV
ncbi:MAG: hypothetical protein MZV63_20980 [Marinilabiliales bacterium]|nr:hypothetical protein [Marinilabiliales bacterium]